MRRFSLSLAISLVLLPPLRAEDDDILTKAKKGDAASQVTIGMRYRDGKGVEKDYKEAVRWTRLAADQGNAAALDNLGFHYFQGWGVPQDFDVALGYFKAAAKHGSSWGAYNAGRCAFGGQGMEQNYDEALAWWKKAADLGHPMGAMHLAMMYAAGDGVAKDDKQAIDWCKQAAKLGSTDARVLHGELLFRQKHYDEAHRLWKEAADKKSEAAEALLQIESLRREGSQPGKDVYVEGPHLHQGYNNCGATTMSMAARFLGTNLGPYDIKRACSGGPPGTGTDWAELLAAVEKKNLNWKLATFAYDDAGFQEATALLRNELDAGRPLVIDFTVKSGRGGFAGHTLLAVGYLHGGKTYILRDPALPSPGIRLMSAKDLEAHWHSNGYSRLGKGKRARPAIVLSGK